MSFGFVAMAAAASRNRHIAAAEEAARPLSAGDEVGHAVANDGERQIRGVSRQCGVLRERRERLRLRVAVDEVDAQADAGIGRCQQPREGFVSPDIVTAEFEVEHANTAGTGSGGSSSGMRGISRRNGEYIEIIVTHSHTPELIRLPATGSSLTDDFLQRFLPSRKGTSSTFSWTIGP